MAKGIKIALPGYDAETDTDPNHFSLFVDQLVDYILIKEKVTGQVEVNGSVNIAHGLGYVPMCLVFGEVSAGKWRKMFSRDITGWNMYFTVDDTNLVLYNYTGVKKMSYHIFYDNIT